MGNGKSRKLRDRGAEPPQFHGIFLEIYQNIQVFP